MFAEDENNITSITSSNSHTSGNSNNSFCVQIFNELIIPFAKHLINNNTTNTSTSSTTFDDNNNSEYNDERQSIVRAVRDVWQIYRFHVKPSDTIHTIDEQIDSLVGGYAHQQADGDATRDRDGEGGGGT
jgi:hypothetical protein